MNVRSALSKIEKRGALLVYPIQNRKEPASLWAEFYPKSEMRWEWDSGGDDRVADLWRLREQVSRSGKAVYAKWYQGRATFFSRALFPKLVAGIGGHESLLGQSARTVLRVLEEDSPLSTKEVKKRSGLVGKAFERTYDKALKELWSSLLIVGYGEVDDGAFPSLAMGASSLLFDDLWAQAQGLTESQADTYLQTALGADSLFYRHYRKVKATPMVRPAAKLKGVVRYEDLVKK